MLNNKLHSIRFSVHPVYLLISFYAKNRYIPTPRVPDTCWYVILEQLYNLRFRWSFLQICL